MARREDPGDDFARGAGTPGDQCSRPCHDAQVSRWAIASPGVAVIGAGGHCKVVIATAEAAGCRIEAVFDDRDELWGSSVLGHQIQGPIDALSSSGIELSLLAIGSNRVRKEVAGRVETQWIAVVHPSAQVHPSVALGGGTVVFAGSVLQPDARVGKQVIINTGATVDHDCEISDFAHIAPGANLAGAVRVGAGSLIGVGTNVIPGVEIGSWAVIGAGAAVVANVPDRAVYGGVPALPLPRR